MAVAGGTATLVSDTMDTESASAMPRSDGLPRREPGLNDRSPSGSGGFDREWLRGVLTRLAARGVFLGTSSWKYPGWRGQLYADDRYVWQGRFSEARFARQCLAEYAEVFKTVSVDAAYYKFPDPAYLEGLVSQVPPDFRFGLKVTDAITIRRFPNLPRFGLRAGKVNEDFLNAGRFLEAFLQPCTAFRSNIGLLMFEFSRFYPSDFGRGRDFVEALDGFLSRLPKGWPYGVEIRNRSFLQPEYFALLRRHGVAHIYNSWEAMPPVNEQLTLPDSRTHPELCAARFLLKPGRRYEDAVKRFSPYQRVREVYPEGRAAGAALIRDALSRGTAGRTFVYVNNRFEGNALHTLQAMIEEAGIS
jgi:uncharacterized protein YecE (DUF72 family)